MLLDVRTYTCRPGTIKKHLELYAKMGAEPQSRNLGKPLLYMTTETGNPNQYVHIWAYENAGDREAKRKNLWADPDWLAYVQESGKLGALEAQENRLMVPVDFFPNRRSRNNCRNDISRSISLTGSMMMSGRIRNGRNWQAA